MAKEAYKDAVAKKAKRCIGRPIDSNDVEVEVFYASNEPEKTIDVDNIAKPTLDALKGIAYSDDRQVRGIRIVWFDKTRPAHLSGRIGPLKALFRAKKAHAVWINVYSESRAKQLVKKLGIEGVRERRQKDYGMHMIIRHDPSKIRKRKRPRSHTANKGK